MKFKYRKIGPDAQEQLALIMRNPGISTALKHGGYIAGGFSRWLARGGLPFDYLDPKRNGPGPWAGDVDIFFPDAASAAAAVENFHGGRVSFAGFCRERSVEIDRRFIKVQLVNHPDMIRGEPERCVEAFDFKNCAAWVHGLGVMVPDGWDEIEERRLLDVTNSKSPFLGSRIKKYIRRHGFVGLTELSREHVKAWMISAARSEFAAIFDSDHMDRARASLEDFVSNKRLVSDEDLTILIGAMTSHVPDSDFYGIKQQVDLAIHELRRRQSAA